MENNIIDKKKILESIKRLTDIKNIIYSWKSKENAK